MQKIEKIIPFGRLEWSVLACEAVSILFFGLFTEYDQGTDPQTPHADEDLIALKNQDRYPMF